MGFWNKLNNLDKYKGNDYSKEYVKSKNAFFYIGREDDAAGLIVFKPFLKSMSYDLKCSTKDNSDSTSNANPSKIITDSQLDLKVTLEIPAVSVSEAKANSAKISKLLGWLRDPAKKPVKVGKPEATSVDKCATIMANARSLGYSYANGQLTHSTDSQVAKGQQKMAQILKQNNPAHHNAYLTCFANAAKKNKKKNNNTPKPDVKVPPTDTGKNMIFRISFANLIQSGNYNEIHEILNSKQSETEINMGEYSLRCFISNINVDVDMEMGFFEDDSMFPKSYSLSMDISIVNELLQEKKVKYKQQNLVGFGKPGEFSGNRYQEDNYHLHDVKFWPFGIKSAALDDAVTNTFEYKYSQKAFQIKFKKLSHEIQFLPLLNKFSVKRAMDNKYMQEFKHLTGVDRIVYDTKMPTFDISFTTSAINVKHSRLILFNYQKLLRMIAPEYVHGESSISRLMVSVGSMIGQGTEFFSLKEYAECICSSLSLKPSVEMGFFEDRGMLLPKVFDISMSLEISDNSFGG